MNAGGVLNTCKSNETPYLIFFGTEDLDEGFMAEDEDGISELDLGDDEDFADDFVSDESDLFLSDDEE